MWFLSRMGLVSCLCLSACAQPSLTEQIKRRYEMDVLRPPSTTYTPGTIALVRVINPGQQNSARIVSLSRYCRPGSALPLQDVPKSGTETFNVSYDLSAGGNAGAELRDIVGATAELNHIDKVDIQFRNATIYRPDDAQLRAAVNAIRRIPGCESTAGRSLVTAVLQADVEVKTTFKASANLSAAQKRDIGKLVGGKFGANVGRESQDATSGSGLFYAIEVDRSVR